LNLAPIVLGGIKMMEKNKKPQEETDDTTIIENDEKEYPVNDYQEKVVLGSKSEERSKVLAIKNKF